MKDEEVKSIVVGSIVEVRNAYCSFFYRVLSAPDDVVSGRFCVMTEKGIRYYLAEDFYSVE